MSKDKEIAKVDSGELVPDALVSELRDLIHQTRAGVAQTVNSALVQLYWQVGNRIRTEILKNERANYGKQICVTLSHEFTGEFGSGFSRSNMTRMLMFAELFPDQQIAQTLSAQLSWSHFIELIRQKDQLKRDFYAEMCRIENWSVRTLRSKINGMLFERTAISKKPAELATLELAQLRDEDKLTPDLVFRDPYFLDFLNLNDTYSEKDLESAILKDLQSFILELGAGFTFVGRQYRIVIDGEDHTIELLQLDQSGIHVANYLTELPPIEVLQKQLHNSIIRARQQLEHRIAPGEIDDEPGEGNQ